MAALRAVRPRGWTVTGGFVLAGFLLLATALVGGVGGVGEPPDRPGATGPGRVGPLTAVQPDLREALLPADAVAAATAPRPTPRAALPPPSPAAPPATAPPPRAPGHPETGLTGLCRALLEDPAGLPGLSGLWQATPPQETQVQHTRRPGGAVLAQTLSVFEAGRAGPAYQRLRKEAAGCDRFTATLAGGSPVTVLLRELGGGSARAESARAESARATQRYAMVVTVQGPEGTRTGWLSLDRVGPVVSVLRQLTPSPRDAPDRDAPDRDALDRAELARELAETRRAALRLLLPWAGRE